MLAGGKCGGAPAGCPAADGGIPIVGIAGGIDPGGGTGGKAGGIPGIPIPVPSVVRTGVGTEGGGGASAKSWWGLSAWDRGFWAARSLSAAEPWRSPFESFLKA